jgi:hypothetical protein
MSDEQKWPVPIERPEEFLRLPGLFRKWEVEQVLDGDHDFHIEEAGTASDGTQLFAVYRREHNPNPKKEA